MATRIYRSCTLNDGTLLYRPPVAHQEHQIREYVRLVGRNHRKANVRFSRIDKRGNAGLNVNVQLHVFHGRQLDKKRTERLEVGFSTASSSSLRWEAAGSGCPGFTVVSCVVSVYWPKTRRRLRSGWCELQCWTVDLIYLESIGSTHCVQAHGSWCSKPVMSEELFHYFCDKMSSWK